MIPGIIKQGTSLAPAAGKNGAPVKSCGQESGTRAESTQPGGRASNTPMNRSRLAIFSVLAILSATGILTWSAPPADQGQSSLLATMQGELDRAKASLAKSDPAPYFVSYEVYDQQTIMVTGTYGTIVTSSIGNHRWADV